MRQRKDAGWEGQGELAGLLAHRAGLGHLFDDLVGVGEALVMMTVRNLRGGGARMRDSTVSRRCAAA